MNKESFMLQSPVEREVHGRDSVKSAVGRIHLPPSYGTNETGYTQGVSAPSLPVGSCLTSGSVPPGRETSNDCYHKVGSALNNVGSNGYYWSSVRNSADNSYNCNFNSGNLNPANNNNKRNGRSVRLVQDSTDDPLLTAVFQAYFDARRHKRNTDSQLKFEQNLEQNLIQLYNDLRNRTYRPSPCFCFIVHHPVRREVFASQFRDRVVHHLYCNWIAPVVERHLIYDSFSCRKHKGTLFGIQRLEHHIRACSNNYTRKTYVLKMDISGYFMSIDRHILLDMVLQLLDKDKSWIQPGIDPQLVIQLTHWLILKDPMRNCLKIGHSDEWLNLPRNKCLSFAPEGIGMPIGDLTSQLFSNLYLNAIDTFAKRQLHLKYYGHYVDDFYVVSNDIDQLTRCRDKMALQMKKYGLTLHPHKCKIYNAESLIPYLGVRTMPHARFLSVRTVHKFNRCMHVNAYRPCLSLHAWQSINSYLGLQSHCKSVKSVMIS